MTVRYLTAGGLAFALWMASAGCADTNKQSTTQPLTTEEQQKKILDDPMAYGPNEDPSYVADHGLSGTADKPSLSKEIHDFWNP
jgi:hypothetical protein